MITKLFKKAAVRFKPTLMSPCITVDGVSHQNCHEKIKEEYDVSTLKFPEMYQVEEGYISINGAFLDRFDAMRLAKTHNMIKSEYIYDSMFFDYKVDWSKAYEE